MERKLEYKMSVSGAKESQAQLDSVKGSVSSISDTFIKTVTSVAGATVAIKGLVSFYNDFVVQRNAVIGLDRAIEGLGSNTTVTSEMIQKLATQLQGVSDIGDELSIKEIFTPLINSGVQAEDVLKNLSTTIADTVAGTGNSVSAVTDLFTKAIIGNSQSLETLADVYKVSSKDIEARLEGITDATERAKILTEALGGVYKGLGKDLSNPLTRLENALGDLKESIGGAFAPMVEGLADSATAWVSNQKNVENLIRTIKVLTTTAIAFGSIKLSSGFGRSIDALRLSTSMLFKDMSAFSTSKEFSNRLNGLVAELNRLENAQKSIGKTLEDTTDIRSRASKALGEEAVARNALNKTIWTNIKNIASTAVSILGFIGIAYVAITTIYQIGKAFGWWAKEVKKVNVELDKSFEKIDDLVSKLKSINTDEVISAEEFEALNKEVNEFNKTYGTTIDLLSKDKTLSEQANLAKKKSIELMNEERLALLEKARQRLFIQSIGKTYNEEQQKNLDNALKGYDDEIIRLKKLMMANKELDKVKGDAKDISALSKYYDMVKFADSDYYEWKKNINNNLAKAYKDELKDADYSEKEANDLSLKYARELNAQLLSDKMDYYEALSKARQQNSSIDNMVINPIETYDMSEYYAYLEKQKSAIIAYYDVVGNEMNKFSALGNMLSSINIFSDEPTNLEKWKDYYQEKQRLMKEEYDEQVVTGLLSQEQADLMFKKRMENIAMESQANKDYYAMVDAGIQGMSNSLLAFAKVTAKSNNDIVKAWYALADAVIAQLKRMVTQMVVNFIWQKMLGFLSGSISSVTGGALPIGTGEGLPFSGGFASFPTSPIGSGSATTNPNTGSNRGADDGIINKLNEVINAINVNSIRGKITTISRIELAKEVEAGNMERSVL